MNVRKPRNPDWWFPLGYWAVMLAAIAVAAVQPADAQVFNRFGPSTGVLKGSSTSYQTSAATAADIVGLFGTCTGIQYLGADGACHNAAAGGSVTSVGLTAFAGLTVTGSPVTSAGTLALSTTLSGLLKGTGSAFTTGTSADVLGLWTGTCSSTTFLRGDGSCATPAGGGNLSNSGTPTVHQTGIFVTSTTVAGIGPGTTGQVLTSGGASADPSYSATPTLTGTNFNGVPTTALTGALQAAQEPAHTGDATNTAGSLAVTVKGANGTLYSGLATGLLKNTTTTGVPSIAGSADVIGLWSGTCSASTFLRGDGSCQTPAGGGNVSNSGTPTTGQLALWVTATTAQGVTALPAANEPAHTGDMTNTAGSLATTVGRINGQSLAALTTGILKNTTTTGVPSIALAADVLGLWTGSCSSTTFLRGDGACATPAAGGNLSNSGTPTVHQTGVFVTSTTLAGIGPGTTGQVLTSGGASADPAYSATPTLTGTNFSGVPTTALTGALQAAQEPAHTGDATNTAGSLAMTVKGANGTLYSGLATGLLKNTTTTGVPSIAGSADVIGLWTGSCSSSTFLRGDGACAAAGGGTVKVAGGVLTGTPSTCTINTNFGGVASCAYNGVGNYSVLMTTSYFATSYSCTGTASSATNLFVVGGGTTAGAGAASFTLRLSSTGTLTDGALTIICTGT